ncbi:hypothetical protein KK083_26930 [Fulvivirgaceae bacterium PWU4]|uniref:Uncharacterized protein n=2 Tax=Chryseosolibacter histidini TaxID=2782349 RepID=A0AAP2GSC9_9BACT|nr:hypothetical protein [Chryseosolibacter histidini]
MKENTGNEKQDDEDKLYYMENGFMVFTAAYHLKRGYCCKNGCRHCPYGFKKESNNKLERR